VFDRLSSQDPLEVLRLCIISQPREILLCLFVELLAKRVLILSQAFGRD